jgi:hypothetical protein
MASGRMLANGKLMGTVWTDDDRGTMLSLHVHFVADDRQVVHSEAASGRRIIDDPEATLPT